MKRLFCLILCLILALSLAACGPAPSDPTETVANPFTQETTTGPTDPPATADATNAAANTKAPLPKNDGYSFGGTGQIMDDVSAHYDYTGGELQLGFQFRNLNFDYSKHGVGPLLFLDGIPQPYKTDEEPWYSYLHIYYPVPHSMNDEDANIMNISFIPVTGQAGDALELYITPVSDPNGKLLNEELIGNFYLQLDAKDNCARVIFYETPPELELPEVPDQVLSHSVTYADEPRLQSWSTLDLQLNHEISYTINGQERPANNSYIWYGFDQEPVTLNFQIYGNSYVKYTLVCYKNYQPISIDPEDILYVDVKDGQRTEVEVQIDMSDFDGSTPVPFMVVLVPRNLQAYEDGTKAFIDHSGCRFENVAFFYFGGEEE